MSAHMDYQPDLPGVPPNDRSPLDMPTPAARAILQAAAIYLRHLGADTRCLSTVALADMCEEAAGGETEAACEAVREAAAYRRMRA